MTTADDRRYAEELDRVSEADMAELTWRMLDEIGLSYEELEAQAREEAFSSERARLVWFAIEPIAGRCDAEPPDGRTGLP
jgi:hypothetical protein